MSENKNIIAVLFIVLLAIITLFAFNTINNNKKRNINTDEIVIIDDYNRFYTVSSCVDKYVNYLNKSDIENILVLLNYDYKLKNNITTENIRDYITIPSKEKTFTPQKIYKQDVTAEIIKYYVHGYLSEKKMSRVSEREDYYIIVYLDESNMTFAIEPYNGKIFLSGDNNE